MLFDAIKTGAIAPIAAHAIFADAIGNTAAAFYATFDYAPLIRQQLSLQSMRQYVANDFSKPPDPGANHAASDR